MTLQIVEGFEDTSNWYAENGSGFTIATGRTGNCLRLSNVSQIAAIRLPTPADIVTVGLAARIGPTFYGSTPQALICFPDSSNNGSNSMLGLGVQINTNLSLQFYRGGVGTTVGSATAAGVIALNAWFYLEAQFSYSDTVGVLKLRVNGVEMINLTGQDTKYASNTSIDRITFNYTAGGSGYFTEFDDLYLATGSLSDPFYGDCRVDTLIPDGTGAASSWVGSDGDSTNNYQLVDEMPPSATDYVASATVNAQDLYTMSNMPTTTGIVYAVCPTMFVRKDEVGPRTVRPLLRRTVTNAFASQTLDFATGIRQAFVLTDPETGAAWTQANINALQAGVEVT